MIDIRRTTVTRLELTGSKALDRDDVRQGAEALLDALASDGRATLLLDLRAVEDMTMTALAQDEALMARLRSALTRLERVAVVGDAAWLETLVGLQHGSVPDLQFERFASADLKAARQWLQGTEHTVVEASEASATAAPAGSEQVSSSKERRPDSFEGLLGAVFEVFETRSAGERAGKRQRAEKPGLRLDRLDDVLVLDLDARITRDAVERVVALLDKASAGDVAMLARLTRFEGVEPAALMSPALWRLQADGLSKLSHVALLTSIDWLGRAVESAAARHRIEVRRFQPGEETAARAWLDERRASA